MGSGSDLLSFVRRGLDAGSEGASVGEFVAVAEGLLEAEVHELGIKGIGASLGWANKGGVVDIV